MILIGSLIEGGTSEVHPPNPSTIGHRPCTPNRGGFRVIDRGQSLYTVRWREIGIGFIYAHTCRIEAGRMTPYTTRKVAILQADERTCEFMIIRVAMRPLPSNSSW